MHISEAPFYNTRNSLRTFSDIIEERCGFAKKTLQFTDDSRLPGYLMELSQDISRVNAEEFPAIAALGYADSYLDNREYYDPGIYQEMRQEMIERMDIDGI